MKIIKILGIGLITMSLILSFGCATKEKSETTKPNSSATTAPKTSTPTVNTATPTTASTPTPTPKKTGPFDGGFASQDPLVYSLFTMDAETDLAATKVPQQISDPEMTMAGYFWATTDFNYIETFCPSWSDNAGTLTLSIYKWNTDYEKTVAGSPVKSQDFVDYVDNSWLQLVFDSPLPSDEYLWVLSCSADTSAGVGIWDVAEGPVDHESDVINYIYGEQVDTYHMVRIQYAKTPNNVLVKLS